ncbi:hypothetical protein L2719_14965 [Shewanella schlegeliana]|uniref:Lipoprotein n=1 Tax=Shewanella schlegeliana TaxID=190308 RepID=A0ABS1T012_9GAMM|nr:hypothetical protein [Shewanella schlegeliana]MBL4914127.1 hypothetical protein [Shewanella schlegeliana]MCL1110836.1 hypothetical protein [Shewanella schlegeliana]GIU36322.1 hypothetical protein TUM4433_34900 [Shewanella schlegeliana]
MRKKFSVILLIALMSGCSMGHAYRAAKAMTNYEVVGTTPPEFTFEEMRMTFPKPRSADRTELLSCFTTTGLFADTSENSARKVANVYLKTKLPHRITTSSAFFEHNGHVCFEFETVVSH